MKKANKELTMKDCPFQRSQNWQSECYVCGLGVRRELRKDCPYFFLLKMIFPQLAKCVKEISKQICGVMKYLGKYNIELLDMLPSLEQDQQTKRAKPASGK